MSHITLKEDNSFLLIEKIMLRYLCYTIEKISSSLKTQTYFCQSRSNSSSSIWNMSLFRAFLNSGLRRREAPPGFICGTKSATSNTLQITSNKLQTAQIYFTIHKWWHSRIGCNSIAGFIAFKIFPFNCHKLPPKHISNNRSIKGNKKIVNELYKCIIIMKKQTNIPYSTSADTRLHRHLYKYERKYQVKSRIHNLPFSFMIATIWKFVAVVTS